MSTKVNKRKHAVKFPIRSNLTGVAGANNKKDFNFMGILEGLFPEIMGAQHLKDISNNIERQQHHLKTTNSKIIPKIRELMNDRDSMALILYALIKKLIENDIISKNDLLETIEKLDIMDGEKDGKLSLNIVRGALGISAPTAHKKRAKPNISPEKRVDK